MCILVALLPQESAEQWEVGGAAWNCILLSKKSAVLKGINYRGKFFISDVALNT